MKIDQDKLDKLSRLADPDRNNNSHERAIASSKFAELKSQLDDPPTCWCCNRRGPIELMAKEGDYYICCRCKWSRYELAREERRVRIIQAIAACLGIIAFSFMVYHHFTDPPVHLTAEERIRAERLDKIDTAMQALQNERDEIDPPQKDYWPPSDYSN